MAITKNRQSLESIRFLAAKYFPEREVAEAAELTEGMMNVAYMVRFTDGFECVLKIAADTKEGLTSNEINLMDAEVNSMRLVKAKTDIKVPEVYGYDTSGTLCKGKYFFMEKMIGKSWWSVHEDVPEEDAQKLAFQVGCIQKNLSAIKNSYFGLMGDNVHHFGNMFDFLFFLIKNIIEDGERKQVDIGVSKEEILDKLQKDRCCFDDVREASLIHFDMWEGNIFVDGKEVTGIIDWERAMWSDPFMDDRFRAHTINSEFLKGFGKEEFTDSELRRIVWYDIYLYLVMMVEGFYRDYEDDGQYRWVKPLFEAAWNKIK